MKERKTRILIVDDHSIVRDGVQLIISKSDEMQISGAAADADGAIKCLNESEIDLAIIDINLKGCTSGIDLLKSVSERFPETKLLVMSMHDESIYGERAIKAGAKGYIMKDVASLYLLDAIRTIMKGELYLSSHLQKKIINTFAKRSGNSNELSIDNLSDREFEIFQLIGNGFAVKEIASRLNIRSNTVESHRNRIKEKLKFETSAELVKHSIQWIISKNR